MTCTRCHRPLFIISVFPDRPAQAWIGLKNQDSWVSSTGSIFLRGRCGSCGGLNTVQDPQSTLPAAIQRREEELGLRGPNAGEVVEVRIVKLRALVPA
jgi:hypothetical protein